VEQRSHSQILAFVLHQRETGLSFAVIANAMNVMGFRGEKGGLWYGATVRRFIQKEWTQNACGDRKPYI
jgi:hypothetical protein